MLKVKISQITWDSWNINHISKHKVTPKEVEQSIINALVHRKGHHGRSIMKRKNKKIPVFKNIEEEAKFWDTHSFVDYWNEFEDVDLTVELHKPKEETLILRLQKGIKNRLEQIAKNKGLSVSSLARMWLTEKLQSIKN